MQKNNDSTGAKWYEKAAGKRQHAKKNIEKKAAAEEKRQIKKELKNQEKTPSPEKTAKSKAPSFDKRDRKSGTGKNPRRVPSKKILRSPLFSRNIPQDAKDILEHFDSVIASVRSLSGKQQVQLAQDIRNLSHKLTDDRSNRRLGYMNESSSVSAYLSYFLWWNLIRLVPLFASLNDSDFSLRDGSVALDIGSGPLTVPIALWLAKPALRSKKITFYCLDLSQTALSAGEELFLAIAARTLAKTEGEDLQAWKIVRVRGELGSQIKEKADLITAANVFNEVVQNQDMPPDYLAKKYSRELLNYAKSDASNSSGTEVLSAASENGSTSGGPTILLVEPGDPKSARFISLMRDALMRKDFYPLSPCPHFGNCPMEGKKGGKWCNFAFSTEDAPAALLKLSEKAGLPKERAVLSFVLSQKKATTTSEDDSDGFSKPKKAPTTSENGTDKSHLLPIRITSDYIKLPDLHRSGYYACSQLGLLLAVDDHGLQPENGELLFVGQPKDPESLTRDKKSGALLLRL